MTENITACTIRELLNLFSLDKETNQLFCNSMRRPFFIRVVHKFWLHGEVLNSVKTVSLFENYLVIRAQSEPSFLNYLMQYIFSKDVLGNPNDSRIIAKIYEIASPFTEYRSD